MNAQLLKSLNEIRQRRLPWFSAGSCGVDALVFKGDRIMPNSLKLRILLVDDDKIDRKLISGMLTALGYDAVTAKDGDEALQIFASDGGFQLILTDINMPKMDGFQLSLRLKQMNPVIPIIAITGENPDSVLPNIGTSGLSCALFKPFNIKAFTNTIENLLPD
jgi:CheY-like chemotaxis protein